MEMLGSKSQIKAGGGTITTHCELLCKLGVKKPERRTKLLGEFQF